MPEVARAAVQQVAQPLRRLGGERRLLGVDGRGALGQRGDALPVEGVDRVADGLLVATEAAGNPGDVLAARAGGEDLTAAEGEGIGLAQAHLHRVALGVRQRTHQEGSLHASECTTSPNIRSEAALGG